MNHRGDILRIITLNQTEDLTMWCAARILEGSFYAVSLAEGFVVVRGFEN